MRRGLQLFLFWCLISSGVYAADTALPFDLSGPKVDVRVKRGEVTLPIGEIPNLLAGDRLWVHPDFPKARLRTMCRSLHSSPYLLIDSKCNDPVPTAKRD